MQILGVLSCTCLHTPTTNQTSFVLLRNKVKWTSGRHYAIPAVGVLCMIWLLERGVLGLLRCWSVPAQLLGVFSLLCALWRSWVEFVSTSLSFWVDDPNRQMLTMALLSVGFLSASFLVPPNLGNSLKMRELCKPDGDPCSPSIWRHWKWGRISKLRCSCTSETKPTWSHGQKTQAPDLWPLNHPGPPGLSQPWRQPKCRKNTLFFS